MEILIGYAMTFIVGVVCGLVIAGRWVGRSLRHEIEVGRLSREEAIRLSDLPGARQ